jgi:hypothetical protein
MYVLSSLRVRDQVFQPYKTNYIWMVRDNRHQEGLNQDGFGSRITVRALKGHTKTTEAQWTQQ